MNRTEIEGILPHRGAMLLLDEVFRNNDMAIGRVHIRGDEWFLQGHFPEKPIVPEVILCEMLAQTACVLLSLEASTPLLTGLDKVKIRKQVSPGNILHTECKIIQRKENFYRAQGRSAVNGVICAEGLFSFMLQDGRITYGSNAGKISP